MTRKLPNTINAVDMFCGAGGTSSGLLDAVTERGYRLKLLAINHWDIAIATHSKNHPYAEHLCEEMDAVDPRKVVKGHLQLLVASPECTNHSRARGGKPINDQSRATAWHVLRWAEALYPDNILVENVPEFMDWGPLGANGQVLKKRKGELFLQFIGTLRALGYNVDHRILNAANYGDATTRERLFILARRGRRKVVWPEPSHTPNGGSDIFRRTTKKWVPARDIIDWKLPGTSIFNREAVGKKPLSENTLRRIYSGLAKFSGIPFIMGAGGPQGSANPRSVERPLKTIPGDSHHALVEPFLVTLRGTNGKQPESSNRSIDDPVPTISAQGNHQGIVEPFILAVRGGQDGYMRGSPISKPVQSVTAHPAMALVEPFLMQMDQTGSNGSRLRSVSRPAPTITSNGAIAVVEPFIVATNHGKDDRRSYSLEAPMKAVTSVDAWGIVEPFVLGQQSGSAARGVDQPIPTVAQDGAIALVEPVLIAYHGGKNGKGRSHSIKKPLPTVDGSNRFGLAQPYLVKFNNGQDAQSLDVPLGTQTGKDHYALCIPEWDNAILDIRFRMLQPHELAAAHSLGGYEFVGTREQKVKQIGNSVPRHLAAALCSVLLDQKTPKRDPRKGRVRVVNAASAEIDEATKQRRP